MVHEETPSGGRSEPGRTRMTSAERRQQILDVAARIFAERGLQGAKTRAIAAECGVTEAVIYKHFESKAALFEAALAARIGGYDISSFLAGLSPDRPIIEIFSAVAREILDVSLHDPVIHKLLLMASMSGTEKTQSIYVSWRIPFITFLQDVVRAGVERGELREVDPLLTARAFVGLVMDCILSCDLWSSLGYGNMEPDSLIRNNVPIFVGGLLRQAAEPRKD